ncbi:DUF3127 domain-containing protein [Ichthyobacterium seriolicida]|uniref:Single-stranded DNA-binding protein n=1 Tax=Ichthyobacterium seriolicida TaxID=242600 RepID=A0A1J1DW58_9FLAO|nr:DUF3127 domain-containing protein [Ichthyobacterium seriolicida]BAV94097.1 hypothetical protein JBKA6_0084 [Ichthyobacterium seriolicida]
MQVTGTINLMRDVQVFESGFRKREIVLATEEQYQQHLLIEFTQDRCELLNAYKEGDKITAHINLRGRKWTNPEGKDMYFNSIHCWKIEKSDNNSSDDNFETAPSQKEEMLDDDDLPF